MHHTLIHVSSEGLLFILKHFPYTADSQKHLKCPKHSPPSLAKKKKKKEQLKKPLTHSKIYVHKFRQNQAKKQVSETAGTMHRHTALD